jgi:hypothetical protein
MATSRWWVSEAWRHPSLLRDEDEFCHVPVFTPEAHGESPHLPFGVNCDDSFIEEFDDPVCVLFEMRCSAYCFRERLDQCVSAKAVSRMEKV